MPAFEQHPRLASGIEALYHQEPNRRLRPWRGGGTVSAWPITYSDVLAARERIRAHLVPTPLRSYALLDEAVGGGVRVLVKHENLQPTGAFKVRNALSALVALDPARRRRGVVAATRGNHGLGLAWAGQRLSTPVTVCVPEGNNPEKNAAVRGLGARVIEEGRDYDESASVAERLVREEGLHLVHSTNDAAVVAGAGTLALEMLEERPDLEALVFSVGGGSQAVGGLTVARELKPGLPVYAVQAAGACAIHDAWHAGRPISRPSADTFADGLATRNTYPFTFGALREGLTGFVIVSDAEIAEAMRVLLSTTHTLVEGAGAAGLAGLLKLRESLAGKTVGIVLSGANVDRETLRRVVAGEL
jgi:threonine dehydratase